MTFPAILMRRWVSLLSLTLDTPDSNNNLQVSSCCGKRWSCFTNLICRSPNEEYLVVGTCTDQNYLGNNACPWPLSLILSILARAAACFLKKNEKMKKKKQSKLTSLPQTEQRKQYLCSPTGTIPPYVMMELSVLPRIISLAATLEMAKQK